VSTVNAARLDRAALCDLLLHLGPDAPTLCTGWTTRDLAAHLVIRERRPDAAAGIALKPLASHGDRVRAATAERPFPDLVAALRTPPAWSFSAIGALDRTLNTLEFFVHLEDVRRAQPGWQPRELSQDHERALWRWVPGSGRLALRRLRVGVHLEAPGYGEAQIGAEPARVRLIGAPGELALFVTGRQRVARVQLTGPAELTAQLRTARLGV
jgi:uncharacterized protein (TIGR03085 family)